MAHASPDRVVSASPVAPLFPEASPLMSSVSCTPVAVAVGPPFCQDQPSPYAITITLSNFARDLVLRQPTFSFPDGITPIHTHACYGSTHHDMWGSLRLAPITTHDTN